MMRPGFRKDAPPGFPKPPGTRRIRLIAIVILMIVYAGGYLLFSHWPARKAPAGPPDLTQIPVTVLKWQQHIHVPPLPPPALMPAPDVTIPPPRLILRRH